MIGVIYLEGNIRIKKGKRIIDSLWDGVFGESSIKKKPMGLVLESGVVVFLSVL